MTGEWLACKTELWCIIADRTRLKFGPCAAS